MKRMKFAHVEGHSDLTYSDDGKNIITCGSDGDYRIWKGYEDDDPVCVRVGDEATAIAFRNNKIYVGTDMYVLQIYSFPDNLTDGIVTRFTSSITHMSITRDGSKIASGSGDMTIKVKDTKQGKETVLEGHRAPVLSVSIDPKGEFLASSSCDGTVRVWSLTSGKQVQTWNWGPKSNDFGNSPSLCRVQFEPTSGRMLAIPSYSTSTVKIFERDSWKEVSELSDDRLQEVSICCWSPCGRYLATSSKNGDILIWDVGNKTIVNFFQHEKRMPLCSMAWNPSSPSKEIAFSDCKGYLGIIENPTTASHQETNTALSRPEISMFDGDDDAEISISQLKKETGFMMNAEDGHDVYTGVRASAAINLGTGILVDDDASKTSSRPPSPIASSSRRFNYLPCKKQEPFQPGSSPVHLHHRYMMWNNTGIVRCITDESEHGESSIEVEFHDTSVHHALHIPNTLGHTIASLSNNVLVLACPPLDDNPSKLVCVNFSSWDTHREWSTNLPNGEEILALGVGDFWIAAATSRRLLRIFSLSGLQRGMVSIPGPVICLAGHGSKLFLAFHNAAGFPGEQSIGYAMLNINRQSPVGYKWLASPQSLPLGPECDLSWAGFSDEGTLAALDSSGMLMIHTHSGVWVPLFDTRQNVKGKSDHYFIVGLSELEKCVRAVLCKGARYPPTLPRPNIALLDIKLPLCDINNEKSQLEETLLQTSMLIQLASVLDESGFDVSEARKKADRLSKESLMKMFALACQSEREVRAMEIADWMNSEQLLQLAIKYATRARKRQLANRLTDMAEQMVKEREANETSWLDSSQPTFSGYSLANSSQSLDADRDVLSLTPQTTDSSDNPILQAKQRKNSISNIPVQETKTIRPLSQTRKNPFAKKGSEDDALQPLTPTPRGLAIFDQPNKTFAKSTPVGPSKENRVKSSKQPTLFGLKKQTKEAAAANDESTQDPQSDYQISHPDNTNTAPNTQSKSGFMLWLDQNRDRIEAENPEATESEIVKFGAHKFKNLSEEERQRYTRKRKSSGNPEEESVKKTRPTLSEKLSSFEA